MARQAASGNIRLSLVSERRKPAERIVCVSASAVFTSIACSRTSTSPAALKNGFSVRVRGY